VTERRRGSCLGRLLRLGAVAGLALAGLWWWRQAERLERLERRRDELRAQLAEVRAADPRLAGAPDADVLIGMPVEFTRLQARQLTRGLLDQVEIALRDIKVHTQGVIETKLLLGTIHPGRYALDLTLHEASALLRPGAPRVDFRGRRLAVAVPVTLSEGLGRATARFDWDSRGIGRVVCEDFVVEAAVAGRVAPRTYEIQGSFVLSAEDGVLVARPDFPEIVLRLAIEPSDETWKAVDAAIEKRSWKCEAVLRKLDVPRLLRERLRQGFDVRVPRSLFKPMRFPAAVQQSVGFEGRAYALGVRFFDLRLTPQILWYGADVEVRAGPASSDAGAGPSAAPPPRRREDRDR